MTSNQIAYAEYMESKRANEAREAENNRANLAKEAEQHRSNAVSERLRSRELRETKRSNKAKEKISQKSNRISAQRNRIALKETKVKSREAKTHAKQAAWQHSDNQAKITLGYADIDKALSIASQKVRNDRIIARKSRDLTRSEGTKTRTNELMKVKLKSDSKERINAKKLKNDRVIAKRKHNYAMKGKAADLITGEYAANNAMYRKMANDFVNNWTKEGFRTAGNVSEGVINNLRPIAVKGLIK